MCHLVKLPSTRIVLEVKEMFTKVLRGELDDIRHNPGVEPEIAVSVNL